MDEKDEKIKELEEENESLGKSLEDMIELYKKKKQQLEDIKQYINSL